MPSAADVIAAELRAQWPGSWVIRGIDRAAEFGAELAARGASTLAGSRLVQVGTSRQVVGTDWAKLNTAGDSGASVDLVEDVPVYVVELASGQRLGYQGKGTQTEVTLRPVSQAIARSTAGEGATLLRVQSFGGRAVFFPEWESTSDKSDIVAILAGVAGVITAGLTIGAAPAAAAGSAAGAEAAAVAAATESAGLLGVDLALTVPTAAVDLAGAGVASWGAAGAELGAALYAELAPGLILAGGAAGAAGAAAASTAADLSGLDAAMIDAANAAPLTPGSIAPAAAPGGLASGLQQAAQTVATSATSAVSKALGSKLTASLLAALGLSGSGSAGAAPAAPVGTQGPELGPVAGVALVAAVLFFALG